MKAKIAVIITIAITILTLIVMSYVNINTQDSWQQLIEQPQYDSWDKEFGQIPNDNKANNGNKINQEQKTKEEIKSNPSPVEKMIDILKDNKQRTTWLGISILISLIVLLTLYSYKDDIELLFGDKYTIDKKGTYGTARWLTHKEVKEIFTRSTKGYILGKYKKKPICLPNNSKMNKHVFVIGTSGTGKSTRFVRPNIISISNMGQSLIVTDPKGELYESMAKYLEEKGYEVRSLDLVTHASSDRWNPLDMIEDEIDAQIFVEVIIKNTDSSKKGDQFWSNAEMNLLKAITLYVKENFPKEEQNMGTIYKILTTCSPKTLDKMFMNISNNKASKMAYNIYTQAPENVRGGIIIGLGSRLQIFQNELIRKMTEVSDIKIENPKLKKCAYFCIMPDTHSAFDYLANLFFSFLFIKLVKIADTTDDEEIKNREVYFLLDEFANIGEIPDFIKKISTVRSRKLHISIIIQDITSLNEKYPNDRWHSIFGNCDTKIFLGCNDEKTAEFISEYLGTQSIRTWSTSRKNGIEGLFEVDRYTHAVGKRPLLNPDEVREMPIGKAIVMVRTKRPLMIDTIDWLELIGKKPETKPRKAKEWSKDKQEQVIKEDEKQKTNNIEEQKIKEAVKKITEDTKDYINNKAKIEEENANEEIEIIEQKEQQEIEKPIEIEIINKENMEGDIPW